jgi:hypothetical protein
MIFHPDTIAKKTGRKTAIISSTPLPDHVKLNCFSCRKKRGATDRCKIKLIEFHINVCLCPECQALPRTKLIKNVEKNM